MLGINIGHISALLAIPQNVDPWSATAKSSISKISSFAHSLSTFTTSNRGFWQFAMEQPCVDFEPSYPNLPLVWLYDA